jgi:hypothetical protein
MSDEQRREDENDEVEGHRYPPQYGSTGEPVEEGESDVEAHIVKYGNVRMD